MLPSQLEPREQSADRFSLTDKGSSLAKTGTSRIPHSAEKRMVSFSKAVFGSLITGSGVEWVRGALRGLKVMRRKSTSMWREILQALQPALLTACLGSSWTGRGCLPLRSPEIRYVFLLKFV